MKRICALMLTAFALTVVSCGPKGTELKNGAEVESAKINGYAILSTTVDPAAKEITYTVPSYTKAWDLADLEAQFVVSEGASWALKTGETIDWTLPEFTIVVTSESNNSKTDYRVVRAYNSSTPDKSGRVVNSYTGDIEVTITGATPVPVADQKIILSRMFANVLSMQLKDFNFGGLQVGDVKVDSIGVFDGDSDGLFVVSGQDSTTVNIGVETDVLVNVYGTYDSKVDALSLTIKIGGVPSMEISVAFTGGVFQDPTATEPIFISVKGGNVMYVQDFKNGSLVYYADGALDKSAFADVIPTITLPTGATMKWYRYDDVPFDPTSDVQYFDVVSKDGTKTKRYNISREKVEFNNLLKYSFEEWEETPQESPNPSLFTPLPEVLQVPNTAVIFLKALGKYEADGVFPVSPEAAGKVGKAAKLVTIDTKGGELWPGGMSAPKVTSGSMFIGGFDMGAAMSDPMMSTQFGLPYNGKKVVSIKGWYKYSAGAQMYNNLDPIAGVDKPILSCVVYDISDNYSATLTGHDTYTSPRIVGVGRITPSATSTFTEFKIDVTYTKPYSPSTANVYKLAFISSASVNGDKFIGAPGSTLILDEIELVTE